MLLFAAWPKVNCNHDEDWWVWRKKMQRCIVLRYFNENVLPFLSTTQAKLMPHRITEGQSCYFYHKWMFKCQADEVGGQTTLNMQIQADISLLLLGDNTLSIIRYGIMNWDGPYFRRPLKPVMLLHRHEIDSQLSVW